MRRTVRGISAGPRSTANSAPGTPRINPLRAGASWRENLDDTIHSWVIATEEPVTTPMGAFPKSVVVVSRIERGELSKYFVPGVGIVKYVFRGVTPKLDGNYIATTELVKLDVGDPKRSIKYRFAPATAARPSAPAKKTKKLETNASH